MLKAPSEIIFKKEIGEAADPTAKLLEKEAEYAELFANPYTAAQRGFIDEVILPKDTRRKLLKAFSMLENKVVDTPKRKHGKHFRYSVLPEKQEPPKWRFFFTSIGKA